MTAHPIGGHYLLKAETIGCQGPEDVADKKLASIRHVIGDAESSFQNAQLQRQFFSSHFSKRLSCIREKTPHNGKKTAGMSSLMYKVTHHFRLTC